MSETVNMNYGWKYSADFKEEYLSASFDEKAFQTVNIPHANKEIPYNNFDEEMYQFVSCYRKTIHVPESWKGKKLILSFEAVANYAEVYVNGKTAFAHKGSYTEFNGDIAPFVEYGKNNVIAIKVDSTERAEIPPFGGVVDYLVYGGIYREVYLYVHDGVYCKNLRLTPVDVLTAPKLDVEAVLSDDMSGIPVKIELTAADGNKVHALLECGGVKLWDTENPNLYTVTVTFGTEKVVGKTGFRTCEFRKDGFYLNGKLLKIRGLNRHQSYPYVGYAMPKSAQEADAIYLKQELGVNLARTSHYPNSKHFLNKCDELGLMVFTEIPGWQYISKNPEWREMCLQHVREMIDQDYNHPCIILWGVRINESGDDDELYTKTNALAHSLDKTRQTGGVRCIPRSHLLEDVYTYNDFIHSGGKIRLLPKFVVAGNVPYLVTEHNGHMFPTKTFDHEKKRQEHAIRHARVLDKMYGTKGISGVIGWCMSDYNTHKDFGSGDKICYHGVSDMFRIDKLAANVYRMQGKKPVLEISSNMEIGDVAGGQVGTVYMFTNCPTVRMYKNGVLINTFDMIEEYGKSREFKNLPTPPVPLDDVIGDQLEKDDQYKFSKHDAAQLKKALLAVKKHGTFGGIFRHPFILIKNLIKYKLSVDSITMLFGKYVTSWGGKQVTYKFEGLNSNGEVVVTTEKGSVFKASLYAKADSDKLVEDETYDVTRIVLKAVSQCGNVLPYDNTAISIKTTGPIEVIGETNVALIGGQRGVWIKTTGKSGKATVTFSAGKLGEKTLEFEVVKK